jgi:uncharacterized protein
MVPGDMGIQMLLNENHAIERGNQRIYLAGIDDAHFYRVDNIEKAATGILFFHVTWLRAHGSTVIWLVTHPSARAHPSFP